MIASIQTTRALALALAMSSLALAEAPVTLRDDSAEPWRIFSEPHRASYQVKVSHAGSKLGEPYTRSFPGLGDSYRDVILMRMAPERVKAVWRRTAVDITLLPGDTATIEITSKERDVDLKLHVVDMNGKDPIDQERTKEAGTPKRAYLVYALKQPPGGPSVGEWTWGKACPAGLVLGDGNTSAYLKAPSWGKDGVPANLP